MIDTVKIKSKHFAHFTGNAIIVNSTHIYIAGNLMQPHATIIRGKHSPPPCNMRHTT